MQNLDSRMNEAAEKSRPLSCGRRAAAVVSAGLAFALALSGALPATSALALEDEEDEGYYLEEQSYFSSRTTAPSTRTRPAFRSTRSQVSAMSSLRRRPSNARKIGIS